MTVGLGPGIQFESVTADSLLTLGMSLKVFLLFWPFAEAGRATVFFVPKDTSVP
jgi:hypothetical protein